MSDFTPGPWGIEQTDSENWIGRMRTSGDGKVDEIVCSIERLGLRPHILRKHDANARLIAAAPDLLAAIKGVLAGFEANVFCRSTDGDHDPAWAIKFFPHLKALADAGVAVEKAEGT